MRHTLQSMSCDAPSMYTQAEARVLQIGKLYPSICLLAHVMACNPKAGQQTRSNHIDANAMPDLPAVYSAGRSPTLHPAAIWQCTCHYLWPKYETLLSCGMQATATGKCSDIRSVQTQWHNASQVPQQMHSHASESWLTHHVSTLSSY